LIGSIRVASSPSARGLFTRLDTGHFCNSFSLAGRMRLDTIAREQAINSDNIEIWFSDEARIGQKNKITRQWAKRGTRRDT